MSSKSSDGRALGVVVVAAVICLLIGDAVSAGVILVSQNRYTREWGEQRMNIGGALVSSHDTTIPASGFLPFNDPDGSAKQNSMIAIDRFVATGAASGFAITQVTTNSWSAGDSFYRVVFNVSDEPLGFHLVSNVVSSTFQRGTITGPGNTTIFMPLDGTLDGTLSPGEWTFTVRAVASAQGLGSGSFTDSYNVDMTFVPEPAGALGVVAATAAAPFIFSRRQRCRHVSR